MSKLYKQLARVYHEMYKSIFDYSKEFKLYHKLLKKYKAGKILEVGCGSGNLATLFLDAGYDYIGFDLSSEMLEIAQEVEPRAKFIQGDMRNLSLDNTFDSILITGRSFTYLTSNRDVMDTLSAIHKHLNKNGLLIFDNFDATKVFTDFRKSFENTVKYENREYKRVTNSTWNMQHGWTWNWNAKYYITENGNTEVIEDSSILRAFTLDELELFLKINGYKVLEIIPDKTAITIVAMVM